MSDSQHWLALELQRIGYWLNQGAQWSFHKQLECQRDAYAVSLSERQLRGVE